MGQLQTQQHIMHPFLHQDWTFHCWKRVAMERVSPPGLFLWPRHRAHALRAK